MGPRTPAWDALWRLILDEIQLDEDTAVASAAPGECAHGDEELADSDAGTAASSPGEPGRPA
jgi:hypothetical protein